MVERDLLLKILAESPDGTIQPTGERCRSLRCKGMYTNMGLPTNHRISGDGYFWCAKTARQFGPDDQYVGDGECRHSGRPCYEET